MLEKIKTFVTDNFNVVAIITVAVLGVLGYKAFKK